MAETKLLNLSDIKLGMAIHFAGDLEGGGRFRNIGVVTGIATQKGVGSQVIVQHVMTYRNFIVPFDARGVVVKPTIPWDSDIDSPMAASDEEVLEAIALAMKDKERAKRTRRDVHPTFVQMLERLRCMHYLAD